MKYFAQRAAKMARNHVIGDHDNQQANIHNGVTSSHGSKQMIFIVQVSAKPRDMKIITQTQ